MVPGNVIEVVLNMPDQPGTPVLRRLFNSSWFVERIVASVHITLVYVSYMASFQNHRWGCNTGASSIGETYNTDTH